MRRPRLTHRWRRLTRGRVHGPVLFVLDHDRRALSALQSALSRRFGNDFAVVGDTSPAAALAKLQAALPREQNKYVRQDLEIMIHATQLSLKRHDFAETSQRYDIILDTAGNRSVSHLRRALGPRGTLVIVGGEGGGRWFGGIDRQLRASMLSPFVSQKLGTFVAKANGKDLVVLKELIEAGKVTPVVDKAYPLSQVPLAIRHLEEGHARGKVAITV